METTPASLQSMEAQTPPALGPGRRYVALDSMRVIGKRPAAAKLKILAGCAAAWFVLCAALTPFTPIIHKA